MMKAPQIDYYLRWLGNGTQQLDETSFNLFTRLFDELRAIEPCGENERRELWLRAERGTIEDYGDYEDLCSEGEFESRDQFVESWLAYYPSEYSWYNFVSVEHKGYRTIVIGHTTVIQVSNECSMFVSFDVEPFAEWLIEAVRACIVSIKKKEYNTIIERELPYKHRTGTIRRKQLWDIMPEAREAYFRDITLNDREKFIRAMVLQGDKQSPDDRLSEMTAGLFYRACALGYAANGLSTMGMTEKEQYYRFADGRDDGLGEIDIDSATAYHEWLHSRERLGGHPWEVMRGGNSTHVTLYVAEDEHGYYFWVEGRSFARSIETIKLYLALFQATLPVFFCYKDEVVARLTESDKVGIVPKGVIPRYCEMRFPNECIIDFMNLPDEYEEEIAKFAVWQTPIQQTLIGEEQNDD